MQELLIFKNVILNTSQGGFAQICCHVSSRVMLIGCQDLLVIQCSVFTLLEITCTQNAFQLAQ